MEADGSACVVETVNEAGLFKCDDGAGCAPGNYCFQAIGLGGCSKTPDACKSCSSCGCILSNLDGVDAGGCRCRTDAGHIEVDCR